MEDDVNTSYDYREGYVYRTRSWIKDNKQNSHESLVGPMRSARTNVQPDTVR